MDITTDFEGQLNDKLNKIFAGKVVRKELTKKIKEGVM